MATFNVVLTMAKWMEHKLSLNRHKGDESGWRGATQTFLRRRIDDEAAELNRAIREKAHPDQVWSEAADVANFAMMRADKYEKEWNAAKEAK